MVELDEVLPDRAPGAGGVEAAVGLAAEPFGVVGLERGGPARVVGRQVDEERTALGVHGVDQFAKLVERRRGSVELGHGRINRKEIRGGKGAAVFAHHGVGGRHGERRKRLDDPKAHAVHDVVQPPHDFAEGAELAREDGVDRIAEPRGGRLDLDMEVGAFRPYGKARIRREEARLAGKDAHLVQRDLARKHARSRLGHRHVVPGLGERRHALLGLLDDFAAANGRPAQIGAENGATLARRANRERHGERVALPSQQEIIAGRRLFHSAYYTI